MKKSYMVILLVLYYATLAAAWTNSTMNKNYWEFTNGKLISSVITTYIEAFGGGSQGQIFYLIFALLPYSMLMLFQDNIIVPNMLLMIFIYLYNSALPDPANYISIILFACGTLATVWKSYSTYNSS